MYREFKGNGDDIDLERETLHVMDDKQRIALVEMRTLGDEADVPQRLIRYQFGNHLGSSSLEVDEQAQVISYEEYSPYGSTTYQAVRSRTETAKRYRYTGKERDQESGLYYHRARYYSAWLGRWTSCDPASSRTATNRYEAMSCNPLVYVDPDGREPTAKKEEPLVAPPGFTEEIRRLAAQASYVDGYSLENGHLIPHYTTRETRISAYEASNGQISNQDERRKVEGRGRFEAGDVVAFFKGLVNGPASWVNEKPFDIDPYYAGAGVVGKELGKNLVIEAATAGLAKVVDLARVAEITEATTTARAAEGGGVQTARTATKAATQAPAETMESANAAAAAPRVDLVQRAKDIHAQLGGGERVTVAVTRGTVNGVEGITVTVNNKAAYEALRNGTVKLADNEFLGLPPTKINSWLRRLWGNTNLHAEELGIRTLKNLGTTGGETATSRAGCWRCQHTIDALNGVFDEDWVHLNPEPTIPRHDPSWR